MKEKLPLADTWIEVNRVKSKANPIALRIRENISTSSEGFIEIHRPGLSGSEIEMGGLRII